MKLQRLQIALAQPFAAVSITVVASTIGLSTLGLPQAAMAFSLTGLDTSNNLLFFDSASPTTVTSTVGISGLQMGEIVQAIDYRPSTGQLFGLGNSNRVYTINPITGAATSVGVTPFTPGLSGTDFDADFNPVPDLLRVVGNGGQNLRLSPVTGQQAAGSPDTSLAYAAGDVNFGQPANIVAAAYTNNFAGATTTTLFGIDSVRNVLVRQGGVNFPPNPPSPNTGQLFTIGALGVDLGTNLVGFDIFTDSSGDRGFVSAGNSLYTINLSTGAATRIGGVGNSGVLLRDIAATPIPEPSLMAGTAVALAALGHKRWQQMRQKQLQPARR